MQQQDRAVCHSGGDSAYACVCVQPRCVENVCVCWLAPADCGLLHHACCGYTHAAVTAQLHHTRVVVSANTTHGQHRRTCSADSPCSHSAATTCSVLAPTAYSSQGLHQQAALQLPPPAAAVPVTPARQSSAATAPASAAAEPTPASAPVAAVVTLPSASPAMPETWPVAAIASAVLGQLLSGLPLSHCTW